MQVQAAEASTLQRRLQYLELDKSLVGSSAEAAGGATCLGLGLGLGSGSGLGLELGLGLGLATSSRLRPWSWAKALW